jgi:hypothetical protein
MIGERREQNAEHDRSGLRKPRCEHEREQLRLVADLGERDDAGGNEDASNA